MLFHHAQKRREQCPRRRLVERLQPRQQSYSYEGRRRAAAHVRLRGCLARAQERLVGERGCVEHHARRTHRVLVGERQQQLEP